MEPEDSLPKLICSKCVKKAHSAYKFQLLCNRSQSFFNSYIMHLDKIDTKMNIEDITELTFPLISEQVLDEMKKVENGKENATNKIFGTKAAPLSRDEENISSTEENDTETKNDEYFETQKDLKTNNANEHGEKNMKNLELTKAILVNDYSDDFNSESDILSMTGEDILSTDDILKSLDLISNVDNQEDLEVDEDEDCDDLKNCIPLGDETVDQLIKDNLHVDNLELLIPKMKSFTFSLAEKILDKEENTPNLLRKSGSFPHPGEDSTPLKHIYSDESLELDNSSNQCFDCFKDIPFKDCSCKSKVHQGSFKEKTIVNTKKQCSINSNDLFISHNEAKTFEIPIVRSPHHPSGETVLVDKFIYEANVTSVPFESLSPENVTVEPKPEQHFCAKINNQIKNEVITENEIIKENNANLISFNNVTKTEIDFGNSIVKSNVDFISVNQPDNLHGNDLVLHKKFTRADSPTKTSKFVSASLRIATNKSDNVQTSMESSTKINDVKLNMFKCSNKEHLSALSPVIIQPSTECISFENSPNLCKVELISCDNIQPGKPIVMSNEYKAISDLHNSKNINEPKLNSSNLTNKHKEATVDFKTKKLSLNKSKKQSIVFKSLPEKVEPIHNNSANETFLFKHPSIANIQSKCSKNIQIKNPINKIVQLSDSKPIQPLESFRRIRTFSIKQREPPNMDYYKKEHEDKTVVSSYFIFRKIDFSIVR